MTNKPKTVRHKTNPKKAIKAKVVFVDKFRSLKDDEVSLTEREKQIAELTLKAMKAR